MSQDVEEQSATPLGLAGAAFDAGRLGQLTNWFASMLAIALLLTALGCREDLEPSTVAGPETTPDITLAQSPAFAQVSAGTEHTCGVTRGNVAYCWGNNELGQLGNRTTSGPETCGQFDVPCSTRPVRVVRGLAFRKVSAGALHTCGVTTENVVYCWGTSVFGRLGNGTHTGPERCLRFGTLYPCSTRPVPVMGGLAFRTVSPGDQHTCGVTTKNVAYCWGINDFGQLGNGTGTGPETCVAVLGDEAPEDVPCSTRPVRVVGRLRFRQVSAGRFHTCGVTTDNRAYCWGGSFGGRLGNRTRTGPPSTKPVRVARGLAFRQLSAGDDHTCGVTTENIAYCWGVNEDGELGHGTSSVPEVCPNTGEGYCNTRPVQVLGRLLFGRVDGGGRSTCGLSTKGVAYCWGENLVGMLGNGTNTGPEICASSAPCSTRPVRVKGGLVFRQVSAGAQHTCGVSTSTVAYCWGSNEYGELGNGTSRGPEKCFGSPCSTRPVPVAPSARH
jgi:alpha-tubulin suppressor-like RCC1 family protein